MVSSMRLAARMKNNKLKLETETIMVLQSDDLDNVHGGGTPATITTSCAWCFRASVVATRSSQRCAQKVGEGIAKAPQQARRANEWAKRKLGVSF